MLRLPLSSRRQGSALLVTVFCLTILCLLSSQVLVRVVSRTQTAHRSAAWNDALTTAAAAVDMTVADIGALVPDVRVNSQEGVALGVSALPTQIISSLNIGTTGSNLASGLTVSYQPTPLQHAGEGSPTQTATVFIDVIPLSTVLNSVPVVLGQVTSVLNNPLNVLSNPTSLLNGGPDLQLLHIRARGTINLSGNRLVDADGLDSLLRRPTLFWDRLNNRRATQPSVSREIEVLLRPVLPFQAAITTAGRLSLSSSSSVVDSFNSSNTLTSTAGKYDLTKRLTNGTIVSGSTDVKLGGWLYGDLQVTGGASLDQSQITGTVGSTGTPSLPLVQPSTLNSGFALTSLPGTSLDLSAGALGLPARYKFDAMSGNVHITKGWLGLGTDIEIYVSGDVTGSLSIDSGIRVKLYLGGNLRLTAGKLVNGSNLAANLQIYGIGEDGPLGARGLELGVTNVSAAIYAPRHHVVLSGNGDFMGAITAADLSATDGVRLHFDEALGLNVGPVLHYAVATWIERNL